MNHVPILCEVEDPATAEPDCDSYFVRVVFEKTGQYEWWSLRFVAKIDGRTMHVEKVFNFGNAAEILGRLHPWGLAQNAFPKYVLLTKEAADILRPAMSVPVFEYVFETSAVAS